MSGWETGRAQDEKRRDDKSKWTHKKASEV